jgi:hypothetical protein
MERLEIGTIGNLRDMGVVPVIVAALQTPHVIMNVIFLLVVRTGIIFKPEIAMTADRIDQTVRLLQHPVYITGPFGPID